MKYHVKKRCAQKINSFYRNVAKKYKHTYSEQLMHQNIDEATDSILAEGTQQPFLPHPTKIKHKLPPITHKLPMNFYRRQIFLCFP